MIIEPHQVDKDIVTSADVCVIGSGAGGGVAAAKLAEAGLSVVCLEAGGYYTSKDFDMTEKNMMPKLYAEKGLRTSNDLSLIILAGSNVGGGTTVNWTMSLPSVDYYLSDVEKRTLRHGLKNLAKLNFEAGATYAYTGHSVPTIIESPKDISKIDELGFDENEHTLFTAHQMATCPMGEDKKITVVNSEGESHEIKNLFVFDGSVFPNSPGVNPMLSIMGFSTHLSKHLISNRAKYFS